MKLELNLDDERVVTAEISALMADIAERIGILDPAKTEWLEPILRDGHSAGDSYKQVAARLKAEPPMLTVDEKKAFGINPRLRIGRPLAETLTGKGLAEALADQWAGWANDNVDAELAA